jgi:cystathionine beta-lyase
MALLEEVDLARLRQRRSEKWRAYSDDVLPSFVAEMDFALAPAVRVALNEAIALDDCGYVHPEPVSEAFVEYAARRWGLTLDPADVVPLPDVVTGLGWAVQLTTAPGEGVLITPPVYPPFFSVVRQHGRALVEAPLSRGPDGAYALDLDTVERGLRAGARTVLLCSPHNPTGSVPSLEALEALAALAERFGALVVSDEIWAPLVLPGAKHVPFASVGDGLSLMSASKAFNLAGLKCSVLFAHGPRGRAALSAMPVEARWSTGHLGALATMAAWRAGAPWLADVLETLDHNRRLFESLRAELFPAVRWVPPQAGYLGWLDCAALDLGPDPARLFLERGRVALGRGPTFGAPGQGFARINLGTSPALVVSLAERMARALRP